jgi:hypothetical protein
MSTGMGFICYNNISCSQYPLQWNIFFFLLSLEYSDFTVGDVLTNITVKPQRISGYGRQYLDSRNDLTLPWQGTYLYSTEDVNEALLPLGIYKSFSISKKFQPDDTLVQYFIISCKSLYMFRVKQSPIIRSSIKLYMQHLVLTNWQFRLIHHDGRPHTVNTRCCKYSLIKLLMMGECFTRNM